MRENGGPRGSREMHLNEILENANSFYDAPQVTRNVLAEVLRRRESTDAQRRKANIIYARQNHNSSTAERQGGRNRTLRESRNGRGTYCHVR